MKLFYYSIDCVDVNDNRLLMVLLWCCYNGVMMVEQVGGDGRNTPIFASVKHHHVSKCMTLLFVLTFLFYPLPHMCQVWAAVGDKVHFQSLKAGAGSLVGVTLFICEMAMETSSIDKTVKDIVDTDGKIDILGE